jgi:diguanylate cyclase (GGDEF)-like protein
MTTFPPLTSVRLDAFDLDAHHAEHRPDAPLVGAGAPLSVAESTPVDHLAELTRYRDRDLLDVTLVVAFRDLLRPRSVAIYRKVGEAGNERWLSRARLTAHDHVASADPVTVPLSALPALAEHPARCEALTGRTIVRSRGDINVSVFPITADREVVGVLEVESDAALNDEKQHTVRSILRVYHNFESLLDCSERDTLTSLLNRRTFDETFLKVLTVARSAEPIVDGRRLGRADYPHWVGMIDIDFFKSVNDKFGHLIGDEVLLLQSRLMRSSFRYYDRLYRFGGEEFVVLLRCPDEATTLKVFERLRNNTAKYLFPQVGRITISVGFTQVQPGDSPSSALGRADQGVYYAKSHGRNQVQGYADLLARGEIEASTIKIGEVDLF